MITLQRLETILDGFSRLSIALVGDLFLDRYLDIDPELREQSIETGLEAYQVTRIRNSAGALGTVMNNLGALGVGRLVPVSLLGDDGQAYDLEKALGSLPVDTSHLLRDPQRLTPTYTKPMQRGTDGAWRELHRLDLRNRSEMSAATQSRLLEQLERAFTACDGLIVMDQVNEDEWGVMTTGVRKHLGELARREPDKLIFIDSRTRIGRYDYGTLKPNVGECLAALGRPTGDKEQPEVARRAALDFARRLGRPVFCTLGERGSLVVEPGGEPVLVPSYPVHGPVDTVGAGDSSTAGIAAALLAGATRLEAAAIGNLVASITVQQLGTTGTASRAQVLQRYRSVSEHTQHAAHDVPSRGA